MSVFSGDRVAKLTPGELEAEAEARRLFGTSMAYDPRTDLMGMIGIEAPAYNPASLLDGNMTAYENNNRYIPRFIKNLNSFICIFFNKVDTFF